MFCRRCGGTWDAAYDVVTFHDVEGDQDLFYRHGLPAMAPWSGVSCPTCGDQRVAVLPFRAQAPNLWVPESRSWVLSCEFVGEAMGPR
jgi:hypothetical protein